MLAVSIDPRYKRIVAFHAIQRTVLTIGREAGRIVLPSACVACGEELPWRHRVGSCCLECWSALEPVRGPRCRRCGTPWDAETEDEEWTCGRCIDGESPLAWSDAWGWYRGDLQAILHAFKFEGHDFLAPGLSSRLEAVLVSRKNERFDALVPVPLHASRLRSRGYNQAELLARSLSRRTGIASRNWLRRPVETRAQSTLPRAERVANVRRAFRAVSRVRGASILLVDDVTTTGETLRACARALREAGAGHVSAVTVARA